MPKSSPRLPAFSFRQMENLVFNYNWELPAIFSDALLMAIFWEETQFNNMHQEHGTAVGLGQVEPAELWVLKKYGMSTNAKNILNSASHAVQVTSCYLRHLYESQSANPKSRYEALKRYAGYYWDKASWRLDLIRDWEACARALEDIKTTAKADSPEQVLSALSLARGFQKSDPAMRKALFP